MRVAIDATPLLVQPTGVGTFVNGLITGLLRNHETELVAYALSGRNGKKLRDKLPPQIDVAKKKMAAKPLAGLWKQVGFPRIEKYVGRVGVVHGTNVITPPAKRAASVITIHDLTAVRMPELCQGISLQFPAFIKVALRRGALVHTPTSSIAQEVHEHFGVPFDRISVIPHGAPPQMQVRSESERSVFEITGGRPYILAVGTIEPRKDYPTLVRAFTELAAAHPDVVLVIAGARGWNADAVDETIAACGIGNRIIQLGYVDEDLRSALFASAALFVYPSLYEGFGFPPLEAMRINTPVVATKIGAVTEVCGDAAVLVTPRDSDQLAQAMLDVLEDSSMRASLVALGQERVRNYDWAQTAHEMTLLYKRAWESK